MGHCKALTESVQTRWLAANEKNSPVENIDLGSIDAVKTVRAVECLAVVHRSTACRFFEK
jgi:hypothetical protein